MSVKNRLSAWEQQSGFTLIELMVAVIIIGIMVAIALPSYRQHLVRNAESESQAQLGNLQIELERWRTTAMSYRGFYPLKAATVNDNGSKAAYGYDDTANTKIRVPLGSTDQTYRYEIEVLDGTTFTSLSPAPSDNITLGRSWVMRAVPNPNHNTAKFGRVFLQRSDGLRCVTMFGAKAAALPIQTVNSCPSSTEKW